MKIGFFTLDWSSIKDPTTGHPTPGGAHWYRINLPYQYLKRNGVDVALGPNLATGIDRQGGGALILQDLDGELHYDCDVIVMQRWMQEGAGDFIQRAKASGQVILNDVDDWYFGMPQSNLAWTHSHPKLSPKSNTNHYRRALGLSSGLIVSTPYLAERLRTINSNIKVVRNAIDLERWNIKHSKPAGQDTTIGWVGSTHFRSRDLEELAGVLAPFCKQHGVQFFHGGADIRRPDEAGKILGIDRMKVEPMCSILDYPKLFTHFDIGIVPLSDVPFNHAKSCIKGMEYAAAGLPYVASKTPEYVWLQSQHAIGNTAKRAKDWLRLLEPMLNPTWRASKAAEQRKQLEALDFAHRWKDWLVAIKSFT